MDDLNSDYLFYQAQRKLPFIDRARGIYMWDHTGKEYIDGCSGAMICNIGHGNPRVLEAIKAQAEKTFFAYRLHFESEPAVRLAAKLVEHSAPHLNRVFYVSGGSEAVESALKLCRQYFVAQGEGSRHLFISRYPSYHGSTLGALALTSYASLEIPFRPLLRSYPKIPAPYCYRCAYHLTYPDCGLTCAWALERTIVEQGPENVAAFVAEPVVGASIGALPPPEGYFRVIQDVCRKYGLFLILDEVMTAFGRTGTLFGYEHWDVEADIVALSKGMAAGYYPLGAIMARGEHVRTLMENGGFAHGHTYAGNPMACAVGLEVVNVILEGNLPQNAARVGAGLKEALERLAARYPLIGQVRGLGLLLALELVRDPVTREPFPPEMNLAQRLTEAAYDHGLIIYPRRCINGLEGDHVLIAPPLIITREETGELLRRLDLALGVVAAGL
ncbi:MAG: aminotransferase class III-fold pyridoxal phosphate-dependent enzyme [Thermodesulfobacteriota bacterium]